VQIIHRFVIVLVSIVPSVYNSAYLEADSIDRDLTTKIQQIEEQYNQRFLNAKGKSAKQIEAASIRRKQCQQFVKENFSLAKVDRHPKDLEAIARAAELAGLSDTATEVSQLLITLDAGNEFAYKTLIRAATNSGDLELARKWLDEGLGTLDSPDGLLPYWGLLGFTHSAKDEAEDAIRCFKNYLNSRYQTASHSAQLFKILIPVMENVGWCCFSLMDSSMLHSFASEVETEMDKLFELRNLTVKQQLTEEEFEWATGFFEARIALCGFKKNTDGVEKQFQRFVRFTNKYASEAMRSRVFGNTTQRMVQRVKGAIGKTKMGFEDRFLVDLERFEKNGKEESENELVLEAIAKIKRHLRIQNDAKRDVVNSRLASDEQGESDRREIVYWFENDMTFIDKDWPIFLEIAKRKGKAIVLAYSDPSIKGGVSQRFRRITQEGKVQFELRQIPAKQAERLSVSGSAIWLTCQNNTVESFVIGTSPAKIQYSFFGNE